MQRIDNKIFSEDAQNKRKNKNTICQEFNAKLFNSCGFHTDGSMKGLAFIRDPDGYWIEILSASGSAKLISEIAIDSS